MFPLPFYYLFGRPFSPLYGGAMRLREQLYQRGYLTRHRLPVPVISVGNLTMGGSGKTPVVACISQYLLSTGHYPAIVSRGYGGKARAAVNVVSDGKRYLLDARQAGDEPVMLAQSLPGVAVLTGKKRLHPCRCAIEKLGCTVIVLDDGFQHLAVQRDLDLVLFNATTLAGNSRIFPGGELREPVSALRRATAFVLTGLNANNSERAEKFAALLNKRFPATPVLQMTTITNAILDTDGQPLALHDLPGPLLAVSGIAHPQRFHAQLAAAGIQLAGQLAFTDHVRYTALEIERIHALAQKCQARGVITTAKDRVKLQSESLSLPLLTLTVTAPPITPLTALIDAVAAPCNSKKELPAS